MAASRPSMVMLRFLLLATAFGLCSSRATGMLRSQIARVYSLRLLPKMAMFQRRSNLGLREPGGFRRRPFEPFFSTMNDDNSQKDMGEADVSDIFGDLGLEAGSLKRGRKKALVSDGGQGDSQGGAMAAAAELDEDLKRSLEDFNQQLKVKAKASKGKGESKKAKKKGGGGGSDYSDDEDYEEEDDVPSKSATKGKRATRKQKLKGSEVDDTFDRMQSAGDDRRSGWRASKAKGNRRNRRYENRLLQGLAEDWEDAGEEEE